VLTRRHAHRGGGCTAEPAVNLHQDLGWAHVCRDRYRSCTAVERTPRRARRGRWSRVQPERVRLWVLCAFAAALRHTPRPGTRPGGAAEEDLSAWRPSGLGGSSRGHTPRRRGAARKSSAWGALRLCGSARAHVAPGHTPRRRSRRRSLLGGLRVLAVHPARTRPGGAAEMLSALLCASAPLRLSSGTRRARAHAPAAQPKKIFARLLSGLGGSFRERAPYFGSS
jgi:hypothetical protein